jgi:hypothetical protein
VDGERVQHKTSWIEADYGTTTDIMMTDIVSLGVLHAAFRLR